MLSELNKQETLEFNKNQQKIEVDSDEDDVELEKIDQNRKIDIKKHNSGSPRK